MANHRPVCAICQEPWPCVDVRIEAAIEELHADLARLCRHCGEPVFANQIAMLFAGPDVDYPEQLGACFHDRVQRGCRRAAVDYRERWLEVRNNTFP